MRIFDILDSKNQHIINFFYLINIKNSHPNYKKYRILVENKAFMST